MEGLKKEKGGREQRGEYDQTAVFRRRIFDPRARANGSF